MHFEDTVVESLAAIEPAIKAARKGAAAANASGKMLGGGEIKNLTKKLFEAEEELGRAAEGISGVQRAVG